MDVYQENVPEQNYNSSPSPIDEDIDLCQWDNSRQGGDEEGILERLTSQERNQNIINSSESLSGGEDDAESTDSDDEERFLHFPDWESYKNEDSFGVDGLKEGFEREAAALALTFLENKLSTYDRDICKAFAYKLQTHMTNKAFNLLPRAFETV
ncbi:hypothetical protein BYT27DRAFT_7217314 [Phlegmacium glaucopus]|nr:hypothetical protein BYT27DRAFT_7217314 [Phlegmacium glaucopus]